MARLVITATADADIAVIIDDLTIKAGANIAARYDADFDAFYRRLERIQEAARRTPVPARGTAPARRLHVCERR